MILVSDQYPLKYPDQKGAFWVDMQAEIVPGRRLQRWWVEISIKRADIFNPPLEEGEFAPWYHYYQFDYHTFTLRKAMVKAWDAFEKAQDYMNADQERWPHPEKW